MNALIHSGLALAALGFGVMAGIYFTFSTFVMKALVVIPAERGVAAMQSINEVIVASPFLPLFFATSLAGVGIAGWSLTRWGEPGAWALVVGGLVYVVGMFVTTVAFNVPLNDALAALDPSSLEAASFWPDYVHRWTRWNHVRTLASALASGLFIAALTRS